MWAKGAGRIMNQDDLGLWQVEQAFLDAFGASCAAQYERTGLPPIKRRFRCDFLPFRDHDSNRIHIGM